MLPRAAHSSLTLLVLCASVVACGGGGLDTSADASAADSAVSAISDGADSDARASSRKRPSAPAPTRVSPRCTSVTPATCTAAATLGRGINLGNMLEAPSEGQWGITYKTTYAQVVKSAGFAHVRLPIRWSNHASADAQATLDPVFAARVDEVLDSLLGAGLKVVINMHHYRQLDGDGLDYSEAPVDADVVQARAINIWRQVAARYASRSDKLLFELYNEPHGAQDDGPWNLLYPQILAAVRETNPTRPVLIGPGWWNSSAALATFTTPTDPNVIVEVHNYEPHSFTHQGAWGSQYAAGSSTCCTSTQTAAFTRALDTAVAWSTSKGFPIYVGEFGSHVSAPAASRENFVRMARAALETRKLPWAIWNFGSDFGVYDTDTDTWNYPLLRAIAP